MKNLPIKVAKAVLSTLEVEISQLCKAFKTITGCLINLREVPKVLKGGVGGVVPTVGALIDWWTFPSIYYSQRYASSRSTRPQVELTSLPLYHPLLSSHQLIV